MRRKYKITPQFQPPVRQTYFYFIIFSLMMIIQLQNEITTLSALNLSFKLLMLSAMDTLYSVTDLAVK